MKVFVDVFSGDELFCDSFPVREEGCVYVIEGKKVNTCDGSTIDFVNACKLQQIPLTKKDFMTFHKNYMRRLKKFLDKENPGRVMAFMAEAQSLTKKILYDFQKYTFFTGASRSPEGMRALVFYGPDRVTPYMYIFKDGVREKNGSMGSTPEGQDRPPQYFPVGGTPDGGDRPPPYYSMGGTPDGGERPPSYYSMDSMSYTPGGFGT